MRKLSLLRLLFLLLREKVTNKIIRRFSRAIFSMYPIWTQATSEPFFFASSGKSHKQNYSRFQPRYIQHVPNLNTGHIWTTFFASSGKSHKQNYSTFQPWYIQHVPNLNTGHIWTISPKFPAKHTRFIWVVEQSRFQVVQFIIVAHLRQIIITFIIAITCQNNFKQIWKAKKVYGLGRILLLYFASNS
jgi:hypothetical protein